MTPGTHIAIGVLVALLVFVLTAIVAAAIQVDSERRRR